MDRIYSNVSHAVHGDLNSSSRRFTYIRVSHLVDTLFCD
jgi:hypothetical protein